MGHMWQKTTNFGLHPRPVSLWTYSFLYLFMYLCGYNSMKSQRMISNIFFLTFSGQVSFDFDFVIFSN